MFDTFISVQGLSHAQRRRLGVAWFDVTLRSRSGGGVVVERIEALDRYQAMQQARSLHPHHTIVRLSPASPVSR